jgi:N-acyl-D-amino-acid deacylase
MRLTMLDCLIKNGFIIHGDDSAPVKTNIGIQGDKIVYIGDEIVDAGNVVDATGLIVSPGFIDTHAHSEFTILADGKAEGKLSQGITTEINGNCGLSAAPLYGDAFEHREADLIELGIKEKWSTFGEYFSILQNKGIAINFTTLCGHGNVRASVIGYMNTVPDRNDFLKMKNLLSDALKDGARGLSTGLIYPPGVYSNTEELIELSKIISSESRDGIYTSHMRSEGDGLIEAIEEVIRIGREAGVNVHISHIKTAGEQNWQKIDKAIEVIKNARSSGVRLTCDRYPYIASGTDLDSILPSWAYEGGVGEELKRLKDPAIRKKIKADILSNSDDYWKGIYVSYVTKSENKWMEGENIFDIALKAGKNPVDTVLDILIDEKARAGAIFFSMNENNLRRFLSLPYVMIGSDSSARCFSGITCTGSPHPRGFGSFPRFIGKYVRDEKFMDLSKAINKITLLPALTFGLEKRGLIKEGYYADITVFDYEKIIDTATFKEPYRKAEGIAYVFVNGTLAFKEGEFTGSLSGRVLR